MKRPLGCPLFLHRNGQWAKKVRGKLHYFGTDLDEALIFWSDNKDHILAGKQVRKSHSDRPTLAQIANLYNAHCCVRVSDGTMAERSVRDTVKSIQRFLDIVGSSTCPEDLTPLDFATVKNKFSEPIPRTTEIRGGVKGRTVEKRSPITVAGDVRRVRAFLNWAVDTELIAPVRWGGKSFQAITAKQSRVAKKPRQLIKPKQLRKMIESASVGFKPILLLGINGAMGASDIANMTLATLPKLSGSVCQEAPKRYQS